MLHFSLDIDNYETPLMAFRNRGGGTDSIRRENLRRMEAISMTDSTDGWRHDFHILHRSFYEEHALKPWFPTGWHESPVTQ